MDKDIKFFKHNKVTDKLDHFATIRDVDGAFKLWKDKSAWDMMIANNEWFDNSDWRGRVAIEKIFGKTMTFESVDTKSLDKLLESVSSEDLLDCMDRFYGLGKYSTVKEDESNTDAFPRKVGDYVLVRPIQEPGTVTNVRVDDKGMGIYTIELKNKSATSTGIYVARSYELLSLDPNAPADKNEDADSQDVNAVSQLESKKKPDAKSITESLVAPENMKSCTKTIDRLITEAVPDFEIIGITDGGSEVVLDYATSEEEAKRKVEAWEDDPIAKEDYQSITYR